MKHPPFVDVAPIGKGGFPVPCSLFSNLDFALLKHPFKRLDLKKVERIWKNFRPKKQKRMINHQHGKSVPKIPIKKKKHFLTSSPSSNKQKALLPNWNASMTFIPFICIKWDSGGDAQCFPCLEARWSGDAAGVSIFCRQKRWIFGLNTHPFCFFFLFSKRPLKGLHHGKSIDYSSWHFATSGLVKNPTATGWQKHPHIFSHVFIYLHIYLLMFLVFTR